MKLEQEIWDILENIIISYSHKVGRPEKNNKLTVEGILYVLKNGIPWNELPSCFGNSKTIHHKFMRWSRRGIFQELLICMRHYYRRKHSKNRWYAVDTALKKAPFSRFSGRN